MKNFSFNIKGKYWKVEIIEEKYLLEEYHKRQPGAYACMGLTFYKEHKIWIAKELCEDEKLRTLKHELTHCYIWEAGLYNVPNFNEEMVCDLVACSNDFVNEVVKQFKDEVLNGNKIQCR